jgi:uncharacterized protein (DUF433 family)
MIDWTQYIEPNPSGMMGKPIFKGTRMSVEFVLERLAQGATRDDLIANYDGLLPEHIGAALALALAMLRNDQLIATA